MHALNLDSPLILALSFCTEQSEQNEIAVSLALLNLFNTQCQWAYLNYDVHYITPTVVIMGFYGYNNLAAVLAFSQCIEITTAR